MTEASSRRPIVILSIVAAVLLVAAAIAVFLLMQRDAAPAAAPSPSASTSTPAIPPSPTTSATPTDAAPVAAEVVMAATGFTIVADDGSTLLEFRWRDEVGPAVAALTEAFGAEPRMSVYPGDGNHFPDYTAYDWSGFTLYDMIVVDGDKPRDEYSIPTWIGIGSNEVGGVPIESEFGLAVGTTADEVRASDPDEEFPMSGGDAQLRFVFEKDRTEIHSPDGPVEDLSYSVFADAEVGSGVVLIRYRPWSTL